MAVNFFMGGSGSNKKSKVNAASNSVRAKAAKEALASPAETSDSGSTAVKTQGTLSKVGNVVGKVAGLAAKFLPGIGGTISKGIANLLNDPEWWQQVPGNALTCNDTLRTIPQGKTNSMLFLQPEAFIRRDAIAEFISTNADDSHPTGTFDVINPTANMVTQYLMPQIRKVVNAIPLQTAESYQTVLSTQASLYALWRQLRKVDYMLKHGTTYLPNMNAESFPVFQVSNAAWLQSTINRLEEYLRSNVRIPHTLCEYLAWRFGRVYKSNASAKAGLILYNVISITSPITVYNNYIDGLMNRISSTPALQQANTDLYNAYFDHDFMVEIKDDTQFSYDCKEFMLRCNAQPSFGADSQAIDTTMRTIVIDSSLDNPTVFMASSISTIVTKNGKFECLFPISKLRIFTYCEEPSRLNIIVLGSSTNARTTIWNRLASTHWYYYDWVSNIVTQPEQADVPLTLSKALLSLSALKPLDLYNKGFYVLAGETGMGQIEGDVVDLSGLSIDSGTVDDAVLEVEQVYAFANLIDIDRKTSLSYAKAEKMVAKDTANLIEKLDVAAVAN